MNQADGKVDKVADGDEQDDDGKAASAPLVIRLGIGTAGKEEQDGNDRCKGKPIFGMGNHRGVFLG